MFKLRTAQSNLEMHFRVHLNFGLPQPSFVTGNLEKVEGVGLLFHSASESCTLMCVCVCVCDWSSSRTSLLLLCSRLYLLSCTGEEGGGLWLGLPSTASACWRREAAPGLALALLASRAAGGSVTRMVSAKFSYIPTPSNAEGPAVPPGS